MNRLRKNLWIWGVLALLIAGLVVACGPATPTPSENADTTDNTADTETAVDATEPETEPTETGETAAEEAPDADQETAELDPGAAVADAEIEYIEIEEGDGEAPEEGSIVSVHYVGALEDGTEFDSSYDRGQPIQFALGRGMVIPGWDQGIAMMKEGGQARLVIPPELAYGEQGAGGVIPPNATLTFEVELVDVSPPPPPPPEEPTEVAEEDYTVTEEGLKYYDLEEGDGATPEDGQPITVHYTGWLTDGTRFDSSLSRGVPVTFVYGVGQVIPGWDVGFADMQVGGARQMVIPPSLAYGEQGAGGVIPPNATLIFEVELVEIPESPEAPDS